MKTKLTILAILAITIVSALSLASLASADQVKNIFLPVIDSSENKAWPAGYCTYPGPGDVCPTLIPGTPIPMPTVPSNTPGPTRTATTWPPTVVAPGDSGTVPPGAYATQTALSIMLTETTQP